MRLSLSINGQRETVAAVRGPGYLSAHLNIAERPKENDHTKSVVIKGIQTLETETVFLAWPEHQLHVGDSLEMRLLDEGEGDTPTAIRRSSESPQNLFSNLENAKELLALLSEFENRLMQFMDKSKELEPAAEQKKVTLAVGRVLTEIGTNLLYPTYRRHRELVPEEMKGELL